MDILDKYEDLPVKPNGANEGDPHRQPGRVAHHDLGPGMPPYAPHDHVHEEVPMLRSGELDVTMSGVTTCAAASNVVYVNSSEAHGWKNPGLGRAQYFVIALGRGAS